MIKELICGTRLSSDSARWRETPFKNRDSKISALCQVIFDKVREYDGVEKSPKRRIETLEKISVALKELASWVSGVVRSWFQRIIACVGFGLSRHEPLICAKPNHTKKCKRGQTFPQEKHPDTSLTHHTKKCERGQTPLLPSCVLKDCEGPDYKSVVEGLEKSLVLMESAARRLVAEDGDKNRFMRCAYRTVKHLTDRQAYLLDPRLLGSEIIREVPDYQGVGEDLVQFLKDCGERLQRKQVQKIEQLFQQIKAGQALCLEQEEAVSSIRFSANQEIRESKIADLARRIEQQIKSLAVGEGCLIPGGHYSHCVVFEVQRTSDCNFQFAIYNTGEGLNLNLGKYSTLFYANGARVAPLAISNLNKDAVSDLNFLMDILRPRMDDDPEKYSMRKILDVINKALLLTNKGKVVRLTPHRYQEWGTSSFDSIRSYLESKLEKDLFDEFERHMMKRAYNTLHRLLPKMRELGAFDGTTLSLIEECAQLEPKDPFTHSGIGDLKFRRHQINQSPLLPRVAAVYKKTVGLRTASFYKKDLAKCFKSNKQIFCRAACRTVRGLFTDEEKDLLSISVGPNLSYKSLGEDLERFLREDGKTLQLGQLESICKLSQQMKEAHRIIIDTFCIWKYNVSFPADKDLIRIKISSLACRIGQQIKCLDIGGSCLVPGGYSPKKVGHAVVFEVQRVSERDFQFAIYNTGEGCFLGLSRDEADKLGRDYLGAPLAIQNLTKETVSDRGFLMDILCPISEPDTETDSMEKLFSIVTKHLVERGGGTCARLKPHDIQTWASCVFDSVRSYLQVKMEPELFAQFETHMMQNAYKTVHSLLPEMRKSGVYSKETLDLIEKRAQSAPIRRKPQSDSGFGLRKFIRSMWLW